MHLHSRLIGLMVMLSAFCLCLDLQAHESPRPANIFREEIEEALTRYDVKRLTQFEDDVDLLFYLKHLPSIPKGATLYQLKENDCPKLFRVISEMCLEIGIPQIRLYFSDDLQNIDLKYTTHNQEGSLLFHAATLSHQTSIQFKEYLRQGIKKIQQVSLRYKTAFNRKVAYSLTVPLISGIIFELISRHQGERSILNNRLVRTLVWIALTGIGTYQWGLPMTLHDYGNISSFSEENPLQDSLNSPLYQPYWPETLGAMREIIQTHKYITRFKERKGNQADLLPPDSPRSSKQP